MKKIYYFAMAVLGTVAMVSCVKDVEDNNSPISQLGKNTITFSVNSGATTRSGGESDAVTRGVTIPLGGVEGGPSFCLEETVTDLYAAAPITRGTPAYTENAGVLYANNMAVYSGDGTFGDATFENMDDSQIAGGGWRYFHTYAADPWPASGDAHFYLRMPANMTGVTFGEDAYTTAGAITFTYTSPATAAAQQDILFAYTEMDKDTYKTNHFTNGMPVLFNHALTGVKFAIGNDKSEIDYSEERTKIAITEISFKGLKDHGTCTITPAASGTKVSAGAAAWNATTTLDSLSSGTYADTVFFKKGGSFGDNGGDYPDSFAAAGNAQNLNDAAGTQTFWLIPQVISADVQLTIKYTFAGTENYWVIDLGSILEGVNWQAGQLRTYTIKVNEVNVKIADTVTATYKENQPLTTLSGEPILKPNGDPYLYTYYGGTKDEVTITNTGNTDVYIRAAWTKTETLYSDSPTILQAKSSWWIAGIRTSS